jgi:hydrogenase maturation protease
MTGAADILVIGFGNPARADDGLGPALAEALAGTPGVRTMWDYQPAVEHAADIAEHAVVIFADAARGGREPFSFRRLLARRAPSFTTHLLPPECVLALASDTLAWQGKAYLMALRGHAFDTFEESLSPEGERCLRTGVDRIVEALTQGRLDALLTDPPTDHSNKAGEPCQTASA